MLTDEEALELAAKHALRPADTDKARKRIADFVRAIYREGQDSHVMRVDAGGRHRPAKRGND